MWLCLTALTILLCSKPALSVPPVICYISNSEDGEGVGQTILVPCDDTLLSNKPSIPPTPVPIKSPSESPTLKPTALCHDHSYLSYDIGIPSMVESITCNWVKSVSVSDVKLQFCDIVIPFGGENKQIKKWCPEACDYDCAPTGAPTKSALPTMQPTPEAQTSVPTVSPTYICEVTPGERSESISDYIKSSVGTTDEDLNNSLSPQSLAFNWIINEDPLHLCPDDPKLSQRYVAATLYYSMGGAKWITSTNFLTEMDECEWYGFSCTDGKISYMDLDDNKLSGSIPSQIGHLQMLTGISLDGTLNELSGTIPDSIGLLENLEVIDLDFNNLTGSIPESIYDLPTLKVLDLNDNNLTGSLSDKIGRMLTLKFLQLQGNSFSGSVPAALRKLVNLETLMLDNNNFEGRINNMVCDNNLYAISADCGGNEPKVICDCCTYCYPLPSTETPTTTVAPTEIALPTTSPTAPCNITPVERSTLILDHMKLNVVENTNDLNDASSPESLALNWIINEDPQYLCPDDPELNQRYIATLLYYSMGGDGWIASTNYLTGVDECEWFGLSCNDDGSIYNIDLDDNNLTGTIPSEIGDLQMLTGIVLDGAQNKLGGSLPETIGGLLHLTLLDIDENNLTGSIPESIYDLRKLEVLDLNDNNLSGSLSHKIGNMTSLYFVQMQGNSFSGSVPATLKKLVNLETLMLENNNFEGVIAIANEICANVYLTADCGGDEPKLQCDCCTYCYPLPLTLPSETVVPTEIAMPTTSTPTEIPILPTTSAPTTSAPTTSVPLTSAPTTTSPLTTSAPVAPTETAMPTTSTPTEIPILPTTSAPTTSARTTSAPLTYAPTTSAPTTSSPTASPLTTAAPTTSAPTETSSSLSLAPTISPTPLVPCLEEPDFSVTVYGMEVDCNLLGTLAMIDITEYCEVSVSFGDITYPIKSWCPAQCGVDCAV